MSKKFVRFKKLISGLTASLLMFGLFAPSVAFGAVSALIITGPVVTTGSTPTITGTITEDGANPSQITVSVDGTPGTPFFHDGSGLWSYVTASLTTGSHAVSVTAVDINDDGSSFGPVDTTIQVDATPPIISSVSLNPSSGWRKIGDTVSLSITADSAGYAAGTITVNGKATSSFVDNGGGSYSAVYTIAEGDTDRAEADTIPVNVELYDGVNNLGTFVEDHDALTSPAIDAHRPVAPTLTLTDPVNAGNVTTATFRANGEAGTTANYSIDDANPLTVAITGSGTSNTDISVDVTTLDDGQLSAYATLADTAGNISNPGLLNPNSAKDTIIPDAPLVSLATINAANVSGASISGAAEPNALIQYSVTDGVNIVTGSGYADGSGTVSLVTPTLAILSDGTVTLRVTQTDAAGNESTETNQNVLKDVVLPTVTLSTATTSPTNTLDPVTVIAQFSENVSGLDAGDLTITGGSVSGFLGSDKTYIYYVNLSGTASISMNANVSYDIALNGNVASNTLAIVYDITGPDAPTISSAAAITALSETAFGITFTNMAENNAVLHYTISDGVTEIVDVVNGFNGTATIIRDLSGLADGPVAITAYLVDEAGNSGEIKTQIITKDTSQPYVVNIVGPRYTNGSVASVVITFSEDMADLVNSDMVVVSGVGEFRNMRLFDVLGIDRSVWTADLYPTDITHPTGTEGNVVYYLESTGVTDFGGNPLLTDSASVTTTFDFTDPVVDSYAVSNSVNLNPEGVTCGVTTLMVVAHDTWSPISGNAIFSSSVNPVPFNVTYNVATDNYTLTAIVPINSGSVADISYDFYLTDAAGNPDSSVGTVGGSGTLSVVDTCGPAINSVSFNPDPATTGDNFMVTVNATDNIGLSYADIVVNGLGITQTVNGGGTSQSFVATFTAPSNSVTPLDWSVTVCDTTTPANCETQTGQLTVVDNDAPTIDSITGTVGTTGETTIVTVNASDNIGTTAATISVNGGLFVPMVGGTSPFTYGVAIPSNSVAPVTYVVRVYDAANNFVESGTQTITVTDNDAPTIDSITGTVGTTGETTIVTVNASDNIGTTAATISVNGGLFVPMVGGTSPFTYGVAIPSNSVAPVTYVVRVYDAANNFVESGTQTITVTDNDAPVLILNGAADITLEVYSIYSEFGSSAIDNVDGNISERVVISGAVNTAVVGDYVITYNVSDAAGNLAAQISRTVHVVDTVPWAVTSFEVTAGNGVVDLRWANPNISDLSGVKIYRSKIAGILGSEIASVAKDQTFYSDRAVVNGTTYYYTLKVFDLGGKLSNSSIQLAATPNALQASGSNAAGVTSSETVESGRDVRGGEVKSGLTDKDGESKDQKEGKSLIPLLGLLALLVLLGTGLYLLYLQNPGWFAWLFFWRKKKKEEED